jgi:excisionase family DNA binding protein
VDPEFLTINEASRFLKISASTFNRLFRKENIPSYKIGGRRLFEKTELVEWVKQHKSQATTKRRMNLLE